jgi:hypothetical protein
MSNNQEKSKEFSILNNRNMHFTDGRPCWCDPQIEHYLDSDVIIHNTEAQAKRKAN